jgi:hypothetical protein
MITGLDLNATTDYILKDDKENPTIWKLGILASYIFGRLSAEIMSIDQISSTYRLLQLSLRGWSNCSVEYKTEEQEFYGRKLQVVPISILEQLPLTVITELSMKCLELNRLSSEEIKN